MLCPFCQAQDTKVIDSRLVSDGSQVRRRRECVECTERFTSYEVAELCMPKIIKNGGERLAFEEEKLRAGILKALEKRPVSVDEIESAINHIMSKLRATGEREVHSQFVGECVMKELLKMDKVAYIRFASVYRSFDDIEAFSKEIKRLADKSNV